MFAEVADKPSDRQSEIRPAGCTWPGAMLQAGPNHGDFRVVA